MRALIRVLRLAKFLVTSRIRIKDVTYNLSIKDRIIHQ